MEFKKNQEIIITIDDLGNNGEGIGHVNGYALFVKDALPGETVRAKVMKCKKNYGFAKLLDILAGETCDVGRVEPRCPVARQCGGCTLQHLSYEKQLKYKQKKVRDCLERIGGVGRGVSGTPGEAEGRIDQVAGKEAEGRDRIEAEAGERCQAVARWLPIIGMEEPWHYRNKAQFPVQMRKGQDGVFRPAAGFYAGRTHSIIPVTNCVIQHGCMKEILDAVLAWMREDGIPAYDEERHQGVVRHVYIRRGFFTNEVMACLVVKEDLAERGAYDRLVERLKGVEGMTGVLVNYNTEKTNVILGSRMELLWGKEYIEDCIGGIRYRISPRSFYQVNPVQTEKLYRTVLEFAELSGRETVWDLYCGIGTISLFLAQRAKQVFGVEVVPEAIANARENARLNGIRNVEFFCGRAEEVMLGMERERRAAADVIVVDPPRKGCDGVLLDTIREMAPERIVYVSCDPGTLARDVRVLGEFGYEVRKVRACDRFPQGGHVETVVMLSHKKPDSVINVKVEFGEGEGKVPLDNIAKRAEAYKPKERVTYKMIKEYIEAKYGFKVHTAYIAEVKRELGLPMYDAPNAVEELKQPRKHPTAEKVEAIKDALKHYKII